MSQHQLSISSICCPGLYFVAQPAESGRSEMIDDEEKIGRNGLTVKKFVS